MPTRPRNLSQGPSRRRRSGPHGRRSVRRNWHRYYDSGRPGVGARRDLRQIVLRIPCTPCRGSNPVNSRPVPPVTRRGRGRRHWLEPPVRRRTLGGGGWSDSPPPSLSFRMLSPGIPSPGLVSFPGPGYVPSIVPGVGDVATGQRGRGFPASVGPGHGRGLIVERDATSGPPARIWLPLPGVLIWGGPVAT